MPAGLETHRARVGKRYCDEWHKTHLNNPRGVVPESTMPGYPWLAATKLVPHASGAFSAPLTMLKRTRWQVTIKNEKDDWRQAVT